MSDNLIINPYSSPIPFLADLVVKNVSLKNSSGNTSIIEGDEVFCSFTISNDGELASQETSVEINGTRYSVSALANGGSIDVSFSLGVFPVSGLFIINIEVDPDNLVYEHNTVNNSVSAALFVDKDSALYADLLFTKVEFISADGFASLNTNSDVVCKVTVRNDSGNTAAATTISVNGVYYDLKSLKGGESTEISFNIGRFDEGRHKVSLVIDPDGLVPETKVSNNTWNGYAEVTVKPPAVVPSGISGTVSKYNLSLSWSKSLPSVKGAKVTYSLNVDGKMYDVKSNKFSLKNLAVGDYDVQIRTNDSMLGSGEWSSVETFTVYDVTAPKIVSAAASVAGYTANLVWTASDNHKLAYYRVECAGLVRETIDMAASFDDLAVGKYTASIYAFDDAGNMSKAKKVKITVKDITPPEKVSAISEVTHDANYKAQLSWNPSSDNVGVAKYLVSIDNGKAKTVSASKLSLLTSKLSVGVHSFKVAAVDKAKNVSEWSDDITFEVYDVTPPAKISAKATAAGNNMTLDWKTPKDNVGVVKYEIDIFKDGAKFGDTLIFDSNTNSTQFSNLSDGNYSFSLVAYDAAGNASMPGAAKASIKDILA